LPRIRILALVKAGFTVNIFTVILCRVLHSAKVLPSVALGKGFAEYNFAFAECNRHSAKNQPAVVKRGDARLRYHIIDLHAYAQASGVYNVKGGPCACRT
jgi:hypothetical protein